MNRLLPLTLVATVGPCHLLHVVGAEDAGVDGGTFTLAPNVMLVVDQSGSMIKPVDPTNPACPLGCGTTGQPACPLACPTREYELQSAVTTFLSSACPDWRLGLTAFPARGSGDVCAAPGISDILVPIPTSDDAGMTAQVISAINQLVPGGGTPTAATLAALANYPQLQDPTRLDVVVLLTDGEPNCNPVNPNDCSQARCQCTFYQGVSPTPGSCPGATCPCIAGSSTCQLGCLDQDDTVLVINRLNAAGILTAVVGFSDETLDSGVGTGFAPPALNAMAAAGGLAQACPNGTDAECSPGDTCNLASHLCRRAYYQANDGPALLERLGQVCDQIRAKR